MITVKKLTNIVNNWIFWLIVITGLAIIIRSIPAWTNAAWGCDFGIYYGLSNSLVENQALFNSYSGWGSSYQYFPVLYAIVGASHWITGIDVLTIMPKIAPIFGGLSVLIFFFVVNELLEDRKKALFASLLFAVMPFHVYQTSHASPLTIGHFFMMLSFYFFIKFRKNTKYVIPLFVSTGLLIMSHHLTTYFYLVSLVFIVFVENASIRNWTQSLKKDIVYVLITSGLIFSYWMFVATPIFDDFMRSGFKIAGIKIDPAITITLFYIGFFSLFLLILIKRRLNLFTKKNKPNPKSAIIRFSLALIVCLSAMSIFLLVKLPWTNFSFTTLSIIYSIPLIIVIAFAVAGFRHTRFIKNGYFIRGWLLGLTLSFIYGLITNSNIILPHRHLEYMMAPLSIIAIYGISTIFLDIKYEKIQSIFERIQPLKRPAIYFFREPRLFKKPQLIFLFVIIFLVSANAVTVYPSHVALNASYEAITSENIDAIYWIENNLEKQNTVIASDHRLARMCEAVGFKTTVDEATLIWVKSDLKDYLPELMGIGKNYSRISHVIIDDIMKDKVVHVGFGKIFYFTEKSYEKFSNPPFKLLYRIKNSDSEHWTEIYSVDWQYIDNYLSKK